jgi:hypothetical protein
MRGQMKRADPRRCGWHEVKAKNDPEHSEAGTDRPKEDEPALELARPLLLEALTTQNIFGTFACLLVDCVTILVTQEH